MVVAAALLPIVAAGPASAVAGNDNIANAIVLSDGTQVVADNTGATYETAEQHAYNAHHLSSDPIYVGNGCSGRASVWYSIPVTVGRVHVHIGATSFDSAVGVWRSAVPAPSIGTLEGVAGLRPQVATQSDLEVDLAPAYYYWVSVDSCNEADDPNPATGTVTFTPTFFPRPANDDLSAATSLADGVAVSADTHGASKQVGEQPAYNAHAASTDPIYAGDGCYGGASLWYRLPIAAGRVLTLLVTSNTYDSALGVWKTQVANPALADLIGVAGLRPNALNQTSLQLTPQGGYAYFLSVDTCNYSGTDFPHAVGAVTFAPRLVDFVPPGYAGPTTGAGVSPVKKTGVKGTGTTVVNVKKLGIKNATQGLGALRTSAKITIHFVGRKLALHFVTYNKGGLVKITIDGHTTTIDLYRNSTKAKDAVKLLTASKFGLHTATITVIGRNKHSAGFSAILWLLGIGR
jgi:hypothetical protein